MRKSIIAILIFLLISGIGSAAVYNCSSCEDCTGKIQNASAGDIMYLTSNITNHSGISCIEFYDITGITFDCQGNRIIGQGLVNDDYGVFLNHSTNNTIANCKVSLFDVGINLWYSDSNAIMNNTANNNNWNGIYLLLSDNNTLIRNTVNNNNDIGIVIYESNNNTLINNTANFHNYGIHTWYSNNNKLIQNILNSNDYGIYLVSNSNPLITYNNSVYHNNLINNSQNAFDDGSNSWDNGSEGNYWDDYNGTDSDGDGIGDIPYVISSLYGNQDNYPLMELSAEITTTISSSTMTTTTTIMSSIYLTIVGNRPDETMTIIATDELSGESLSDVEFRIDFEGVELLEDVEVNGILLFTPSESGIYTIVAHKVGYATAVVEWEITYNLLPELQCKTNISGTLPTNTTWSPEGSPYCITEDIVISDGNILTIEPRTEIAFNDSTMHVNGTLIAIGNENDKILFEVYVKKSQSQLLFVGPYTSVLDNFIMQNLDLTSVEEDSGKINLTNGKLKNSDILIRYSYVYNNEFENCNVGIYEAYWKETMKTINVLNNTFHSGTSYLEIKADDAPLNFINNSIQGYNVENCVIAIGSSWLLDFSHNTIHNNLGKYAICTTQTYDSSLTHNLIYDNTCIGILGSTERHTLIEFNTIANNDVGVSINLRENSTFRNNNVYNNTEYDAKTDTDDEGALNLSNNYWGTTNSSLISEQIYDYYDNIEFKELIYEPFLTELVSEAPSIPVIPTIYTCNSCSDCNEKIQNASAGDTVYLGADIVNQSDTCIVFHASNVKFNCQGHLIDGKDLDKPSGKEYGISMNEKSNNTVRNCIITEFDCGIYLEYSSHNTLVNNSANSNDYYGIRLKYSSNNTLNSNQFCYNPVLDISLVGGSENSGDENTCDSYGAWSDTGTSGCTYTCSGECLKGDSNCDGTVSDSELLAYIDRWIQGEVSGSDLLIAIDNWMG